MAKQKQTNLQETLTKSYDEKVKIYKQNAKRANVRMKLLEDKGKSEYNKAYIEASFYNVDQLDKLSNRFTETTKFTREEDLNEALINVIKFNNSRESTLTAIKQNEKIKEYNNTWIEKLQDHDFTELADLYNSNRSAFEEFLNSNEFKALRNMADSDQILEDFAQAFNQGFSYDEIMKSYETFKNSNMTFEQVAEQRQKAIDKGVFLH